MIRSASLWLVFAAPLFAASTAQAQSVLFSDDFENGTANWLPEYWWHLADASSHCLQDTFPSGTHCMWYGREDNCWYDGVFAFAGLHLAAPLDVPAAPASTALEFWTRSEVEEDTTWDTRSVDVSTNGGANWTALFFITPSVEPWTCARTSARSSTGWNWS